MKLNIVGLGPGPFCMVTQAALYCMKRADIVFVQTKRHPAAQELQKLGVHVAFMDDLYEQSVDFDALNQSVVERVLSSSEENVAFAVSGQGIIGQAATPMLLEEAKKRQIEAQIIPGLGYEAAIAACQMDASGGYCVSIGRLNPEGLSSEVANIVADVDSKLKASDVKIALMQRYADETTVYFMQFEDNVQLCLPIPLKEIDRQKKYDASTLIVVPPQPFLEHTRFTAYDLMEICRILRAPDGCPWDKEQTHHSIRRNMMEEACEAMAAISEGDDEHLCEELGDVLLQITLHCAMAEEDGAFDLTGVTTGICQKMIRRHPHIFSDAKASTSAQVLENWEQIKIIERNGAQQNPLKKIGEGLPSLMRAQELQKKLRGAKSGASPMQELYSALKEFEDERLDMEQQEQSAGRALWAMCEWLLQRDVHAETALSDACSDKVANYHSLNSCE